MLRAIEEPFALPSQTPNWALISPSTLQIVGQQVNADWAQMLATPPPGGYTAADYWLQAKRFIAAHSTVVYLTSAGLLALALIGGSRRW
jgi:hypothetical protein